MKRSGPRSMAILSVLAPALVVLGVGGGAGRAQDAPAPAAAPATAAQSLDAALSELTQRKAYEVRLLLDTNLPDLETVATMFASGRVQQGAEGRFQAYFASVGERDLEVYVRGDRRAAREVPGTWVKATGMRGIGRLEYFRFPPELWALVAAAGRHCEWSGSQRVDGRDCRMVTVGFSPEGVAPLLDAWKHRARLDPDSVLATCTFWLATGSRRLLAAALQVDAAQKAPPGANVDALPRLSYYLRIDIGDRVRAAPFTIPAEVARLLD